MIDLATTITQQENAHTSGAYPKRPLIVVRGEGCTVYDEAGNAYLDMTSGQGVAALGHAHPAVVEAIAKQAQTLVTSPEIFYNDRRAELYGILANILPDDLSRFFLCNSGAEAVEGALKLARMLTGRSGIVATKRAFHGRTTGALSLTWNPKYRKQFSDWLPPATHITYEDLDAAREAISEDTAAVVVEAVQGEGGVYPASPEFLQGLRQICDEHGALLLVDEIQMGFGRTGRWFGFQHADILPDIVMLGKAIGGGVPMGAVAWRDSLGTMDRSGHGSTFGGNPLACASAIATLNTLQNENIPERVAELGTWFIEALRDLNLPQVREVRGTGLIVGLELRGRATSILKELQERGILALPAGATVLRFLPPLIITKEELQRVLDVLPEVLS